MGTTQTYEAERRRKRLLWFTFLAGSLTLILLFAGLFEFIPAWILKNPLDQIHLWHIAELTALTLLLLGGTMFGLVLYPQEQPLLAQFFVLALLIATICIVPFDVRGAVCLPLAALVSLAYPDRRALLSFKQTGPISKVLFTATLVFAVCMDPVIWQEVNYQVLGMSGGDPHAQLLHWIGSALLMILLIVAGLLASTRRPGWKTLSAVTGITYCFLGVIAMLTEGYAGSWGQFGGLFATFGGVLYIMLAVVVAKETPARESNSTQMNLPATEHASRFVNENAEPVAAGETRS
jgi:MFS family permease